MILHTPAITALMLLGFVLLAVAASLLFERRTFCRHLCPVGGFVGLHSQAALVEIRVKDIAVCAGHREKTCPHDNLALFVRPPTADLWAPRSRRMDEAFKGLIMLACAFIYSAVLIGPWGILKQTAAAIGTPAWSVYAVVFLMLNLAILPGLLWLAVRLGQFLSRRSGLSTGVEPTTRKLFAEYAVALIPLGLTAWIAFSLSFVLLNFSYAWSVLSDPLGWGWNLMRTASLSWTPYVPGLVSYLQTPVLHIGLALALALALRTARRHGQPSRSALPVALFCTAATVGLLALYLA